MCSSDLRQSFLDTGGLEESIIEYIKNDLQEPRTKFIPREFYFTLPGAQIEKWDGNSKVFKQIMNASTSVFARPEFVHWEEHTGKVNSSLNKIRHWRLKAD